MIKTCTSLDMIRRGVPYGWTKLYRFYEKDAHLVCPWWLYPLLRPYFWMKERDYILKRLVYTLGYLNTPEWERFSWAHLAWRGAAQRRQRNFAALRAYKALKPHFQ